MPAFVFRENGTFQEGVNELIAQAEQSDPEMGKILRENSLTLLSIMTDGERDPKKRAEFNASVLEALDQLVEQDRSKGGDEK